MIFTCLLLRFFSKRLSQTNYLCIFRTSIPIGLLWIPKMRGVWGGQNKAAGNIGIFSTSSKGGNCWNGRNGVHWTRWRRWKDCNDDNNDNDDWWWWHGIFQTHSLISCSACGCFFHISTRPPSAWVGAEKETQEVEQLHREEHQGEISFFIVIFRLRQE